MYRFRRPRGRARRLTKMTLRPPNRGSEKLRERGPEGLGGEMAKKKNPHIGRSLDEFIVEQRVKDPEFRAEFDRLQLARKVKGLREKKKMSQVQLAALAGTKQPNIARLESGKVVPKLDFLEKVARALGGHLDIRIVERKSNA